MRRPRLSLAPVVVLLLALPLAADMRTAPTTDGATPASLEGTITHLAIPFAGGGPIVSLLGGLLSFDAAGAAVRFANGEAGTTSSLAVGQRIVAFVDPASSPLAATSIVVFEQKNEVALTGPVQAVDVGAKTMQVLGFSFRVDRDTVFGGPWDGAGQAGLEDLKVGDLVLVAATSDAGVLLARKVMKLSPSPTRTVRLSGVVATVGTESWTITLGDGTAQAVRVDARTKYVGEPKVGDEVGVLAQKQADGSYLALVIAKAFAPAPAAEVSFEGVVKGIVASSSATGMGAIWTVDTTKVLVMRTTTVVGAPKVGDEVRVEGMRSPDGSVLARRIARI